MTGPIRTTAHISTARYTAYPRTLPPPSLAPEQSTILAIEPLSPHIPRPRNAWIIFRTLFQKILLKLEGDSKSTQRQVSKKLSTMWQKCKYTKNGVYRHFAVLAERAKKDHQENYPNYKYQPKKKGEKKKSASCEELNTSSFEASIYYPTQNASPAAPFEELPLLTGPSIVSSTYVPSYTVSTSGPLSYYVAPAIYQQQTRNVVPSTFMPSYTISASLSQPNAAAPMISHQHDVVPATKFNDTFFAGSNVLYDAPPFSNQENTMTQYFCEAQYREHVVDVSEAAFQVMLTKYD